MIDRFILPRAETLGLSAEIVQSELIALRTASTMAPRFNQTIGPLPEPAARKMFTSLLS